MDHFKGIDIIVNNAGYTWDNVIQKMTDEQWYAIIDCHLTAPFRILRAAQPHIKALHAAEVAEEREVFRKIVNISSTSALNGNAGQMNYSSAKAGVIGLTRHPPDHGRSQCRRHDRHRRQHYSRRHESRPGQEPRGALPTGPCRYGRRSRRCGLCILHT